MLNITSTLSNLTKFLAVAAAALTLTVSTTAVQAGEAPKVGEKAPNFTLSDLDGREHSLKDFTKAGKVVVLEWYNPQCPFVKKHYKDDTMTMNKLEKDFKDKDVVWVRINSGAEGKQGAGLTLNREYKEKYSITGPILLDMDGKVGKKYGAKRTPEMYVIDTEGVLRYHGAIDNVRRADKVGDINYVHQALNAVLNGETVSPATTQAYGCSVKYAS